MVCCLCLALPVWGTEPGDCEVATDWQSFLARHDLVWDELPVKWHEGAHIGNGLLGLMVYAERGAEAGRLEGLEVQGEPRGLRWEIGRSDVYETHIDYHWRLPIGRFVLEPVGNITGYQGRLDLWNAEAKGELKTDRGHIRYRTFASAAPRVIVIELEPSEGERGCRMEWKPAVSVVSLRGSKERTNPPPIIEHKDAMTVCQQPIKAGGEYTTAFAETTREDGTKTLLVSVGYCYEGVSATREAMDTVRAARAKGVSAMLAAHRRWWHQYYPQSFFSISDTWRESFYWIQMYKLASGTRADGAALDLLGPWYRYTRWPDFHWNLDTELTYWPVYASNRLHLGESFCAILDRNVENLIHMAKLKGVPDAAVLGRATDARCRGWKQGSGREFGNLPWACHNYWLQYRYSMDPKVLERLFPLLRRSINFYLHILEQGDDGRLHLPPTGSPESATVPDCNYDLGLLRWGCQALLEASERLGIDDPLIPRWRETLRLLVDFPVDENGFMTGTGRPAPKGHRHYAHLMMVYPLYLVNWDQKENRELIEKTLKYWYSSGGHGVGFVETGAGSVYAMMGRGEEAWKNMELCGSTANGMFVIWGHPIVPYPMSQVKCMHDMVLASWGDAIRVFPALPDAWPEVVIHNMRTEGAFLVSAVRKAGTTRFVRIHSEAGEPCRLQTDMPGPLVARGPRTVAIEDLGDGFYRLDLRKGESILVYPEGSDPDLTIEAVSGRPEESNAFGLNPRWKAATGRRATIE